MASLTNTTVKVYLKDKSPDRLIKKQLANNIKYSAAFEYDIVFAGGFWYAWFEMDLNALRVLNMLSLKKGDNHGQEA
jgi:hypothetical protein